MQSHIVEPNIGIKHVLSLMLFFALIYVFTWHAIDFLLYGDLEYLDRSERKLVLLVFLHLPLLPVIILLLPYLLLRRPGTGVFCETGAYLKKTWKTVHFDWADLGTAIPRQRGKESNQYEVQIFYRNREHILKTRGSFPPEAFVPTDCKFSGPFTLSEAQTICEIASDFSSKYGVGPSNKINEEEFQDKYHWSKKSGYLGIVLFGMMLYPMTALAAYLILNKLFSEEGGIAFLILKLRETILPLL